MLENSKMIHSNAKMASLALLLLVLPVSAASQSRRVQPEAADPTVQAYFEMARRSFSADRAFETVAFMENQWRLPGNSGFDASIYRVEQILVAAGYVREEEAGGHPFTYRIEKRPMRGPAWDPVDASLTVVGESKPLLQLHSNWNLLAIYSFPTPPEGIEAEVVYVGRGRAEDFEGLDVTGKIVLGETSSRRLFQAAVQDRGALGILAYSMPAYNRPEIYRHAIQFSSIQFDEEKKSWGLRISLAALEHLKKELEKGKVLVQVTVDSRIFESEELTLIADIRGSELPDERFVFSAHVQEPGANDNASGVATQAEMAAALSGMVNDGMSHPRRSITFIWGDEISSTARYLGDDPERSRGVKWGISLDMVGENTSVTGGSFLIEKMPDPSAVWTRGEDRHTEWWGSSRSSRSEDQLTPHYFNDFVLSRCLEQAAAVRRWVVKTNPYEGGSDHVPFLRAGKPGLLLWHFTDYFYHTDADRLDKVSSTTMRNVGVSALVSALTLASADSETAGRIAVEIKTAAMKRLEGEFELSRTALEGNADLQEEVKILTAWKDWYVEAILSTVDIEVGGSSPRTAAAIEEAADNIDEFGTSLIEKLRSGVLR